MVTIQVFRPCLCCDTGSPQPFWHQGLVSWKTIFPQPGVGRGWFGDDSCALGLPWGPRQESICLQGKRPGLDPWVRKILYRRKWQLTPVLLPGKSYGWRSLVSYSPWSRKELDTTEWFYFPHVHLSCTLLLLILLLHQLHLRSSDFRSWRLGTPGIEGPTLSP